MTRYRVEVKSHSHDIYEIEADSKEEAVGLYESGYESGELEPIMGQFFIDDIEVTEQEGA